MSKKIEVYITTNSKEQVLYSIRKPPHYVYAPSYEMHRSTEADNNRRPSLFRQSKNRFVDDQGELHTGTYGTVRFFTSDTGKCKAIKQQKQTSTFKKRVERSLHELYFLATAYPDMDAQVIVDEAKECVRLIMPDLGTPLIEVLHHEHTTAETYWKLILETATELNRLHNECSILHGDVSEYNILVHPTGRIFFVDGACYETRGVISHTEPLPTHCAPELNNIDIRFGRATSIKEDVYAFGCVLEACINGSRREVIEATPLDIMTDIVYWMKRTRCIYPQGRPTLDMLINSLEGLDLSSALPPSPPTRGSFSSASGSALSSAARKAGTSTSERRQAWVTEDKPGRRQQIGAAEGEGSDSDDPGSCCVIL